MSSKSNNRWIQHVREYAKENNISYACAVSHASKTYTRTTNDDKKHAEQLKTNEGLKMHMKRMRKQYNEGKDDDYQLNILKMKFNRFNNIVKNYIQKNDPTLYDALSIVQKQTPTETIISNDAVQEVQMTAPTEATVPQKRGKLIKGSPESKAYMASIRRKK